MSYNNRNVLWLICNEGVPWMCPLVENPKSISSIEWQPKPFIVPFSQIVSSSECSYALTITGKLMIFVFPSDILIRSKIELYVHQRKFPFIGWARPSLNYLSQFTDESGETIIDPDKFPLDPGWNWEEPWTPHIDPRRYDSEGWEYLSTANNKWSKSYNSKRRRKLLKRHKRFITCNQWIEMEEDAQETFKSIALGGSGVLDNGKVFLFGLHADGDIFRRCGINLKCPNGTHWEKLHMVKILNTETDDSKKYLMEAKIVITNSDIATITSSSYYGTLVCLTFDGKLCYRHGIDEGNPNGLFWSFVASPNNLPIHYVSIGKNSLWCTTNDGNLWYADVNIIHGQQMLNKLNPSSYRKVTKWNGIISLSKNDQLIGISSISNLIEYREGISNDEKIGKYFKPIIQFTEGAINNSWISIHFGNCSLSEYPEYLTNQHYQFFKEPERKLFINSEWRKMIYNRLDDTNKKSWSIMNNIPSHDINIEENDDTLEFIKDIENLPCEVSCNPNNTFRKATVFFNDGSIDISVNNQFRFLDHETILSATPSFLYGCQKYIITILVRGSEEYLRIAFSDEISRNKCLQTFQNIIYKSIKCDDDLYYSTYKTWSISNDDYVLCSIYENKQSDAVARNLEVNINNKCFMIPGNFEYLDAGCDNIVWAINNIGELYALDLSFNPLSKNEDYFGNEYILNMEYKVYEYQKSTFLRGFTPLTVPLDGIYPWTIFHNQQPSTGLFSCLPSHHWSWVDTEWQNNNDWQYSKNIRGPYASDPGKDYRRRIWTRNAKYQLFNSPWIFIDSPSMQIVKISKDYNSKDMVTVVALTKTNEILIREGVTRNNIEGTKWIHVLTDYPIKSLDIDKGNNLWCITNDTRVLMKHILNDESNGWTHYDNDDMLMYKPYFQCDRANNIMLVATRNFLFIKISQLLLLYDTRKNVVQQPIKVNNLSSICKNQYDEIVLTGERITTVHEWSVTYGNRTTIHSASVNANCNFKHICYN